MNTGVYSTNLYVERKRQEMSLIIIRLSLIPCVSLVSLPQR